MNYRQLGKSSVKVSPIVMGTWAIGGWMWGGTDKDQAIAALHKSIDLGVNTIDTAAVYGFGLSEEIVGASIRGRREEVVIATKCGLRWDGDENPDSKKDPAEIGVSNNLKPESIRFECERSLSRLGIDCIDLYQIHWPDRSCPLEDSWEAMAKLKEEGKVRAIGVSNFSLEQLKQAHAIHPVDSIQPPYSLIRRDIEKELVPFCKRENIGIISYSSLERGLLTGKVSADRTFDSTDHRSSDPLFSLEKRKLVLDALNKIAPIAEKYSATIAQTIIHCTFYMPGITAALVGARNPQQAEENAQACQLGLSAEERDTIVNTLRQVPLKI